MSQDQFTFRQGQQSYHADEDTIRLLRDAQKWDTMNGQPPRVAQEILDRGIANGRIHEGLAPRQDQEHETGQATDGHTETLDIDGARYAASKETMEAIDRALQDGKIDPEDGFNAYEIEDRRGRFHVAIDSAIREGDLVYLERAPSELFAINGDHETPIERRGREQEEYIERRQDEVASEDIRDGSMRATPEGVRLAFKMEPAEAVQRGLITETVDGGERSYRSMAAYTETVDIDGARFLAPPDTATTIEESYRSTLNEAEIGWTEHSMYLDEFARDVNEAIYHDDLIYHGPAPDQHFRINGALITPREQEQYQDDGWSLADEDHLYAIDRDPFRSALDRAENPGRDSPVETNALAQFDRSYTLTGRTPHGIPVLMDADIVRDLVKMEPEEAVRRGLVFMEQSVDRTLYYQATPRLAREMRGQAPLPQSQGYSQ